MIRTIFSQTCMRVVVGAVLVVCALSIFIQRSNSLPYENDEVSWFFHTQYFDLAFLHRDFSHPSWFTYEAYDHPPLVKYIFGFVLWSYDKEFSVYRQFIESQITRWDYYDDQSFDVSSYPQLEKYISVLRAYQIGLAVAGVVLFYVIVLFFSRNIFLSLIGALLLVRNPLFQASMLRAVPDGTMIVFLFAFILSAVLFLRTNEWKYMVVAGLFLGAAISSKLSAIALIAGIIVFLVLKFVYTDKFVFVKYRYFIGLLLTALFFWYITNPTVYAHALKNSYTFIAFRVEQTKKIQDAFPQHAITQHAERIRITFCVLLYDCNTDNVPNGRLLGDQISNIIVLLLGMLYGGLKILRKNRELTQVFLLSISSQVLLYTVVYLPLIYDRYFLPLIPITIGCMLLGLRAFVPIARFTWRILAKIIRQ